MKITAKNLFSITAIALLAGCGGGTSTAIKGSNGLPFASGQTADVATLLAANQQVTGIKAAAANHLLTPTSRASNAQTQNLGISVTAADVISISVGGEGATLSQTGMTGPYTNPAGDQTNISMEVFTDESIFYGEITETPGTVTNYSDTFFVTGFQSDPAQLTSASATYDGSAKLVGRTTGATTTSATATTILDGTLSMTVDFTGGGTVNGTMSDSGGALDLTLAQTTVSGTSFSTTATKSGGTSTVDFIAPLTVNGQFFGENGNQVGGTMSGIVTNGTLPGSADTSTAGYFLGDCTGC